MANSPDVVVGVDDSPNSLHAMSVAASEAARRGTGVLAIHVWHAAATWGVPLAWRPRCGSDPQLEAERV